MKSDSYTPTQTLHEEKELTDSDLLISQRSNFLFLWVDKREEKDCERRRRVWTMKRRKGRKEGKKGKVDESIQRSIWKKALTRDPVIRPPVIPAGQNPFNTNTKYINRRSSHRFCIHHFIISSDSTHIHYRHKYISDSTLCRHKREKGRGGG